MVASEPLVSILIPAYNARPWVARAVESALGQSWKRCEVIVVDDCSTDDTDRELKQFEDSIYLERSVTNGGQNRTRNRLTELSSGEWLVYLDADDALGRHTVETKLECAADADAIYGTTKIAAYEGQREIRSETIVAEDYDDLWAAAFAWKFPNTSAFCFRLRVARSPDSAPADKSLATRRVTHRRTRSFAPLSFRPQLSTALPRQTSTPAASSSSATGLHSRPASDSTADT